MLRASVFIATSLDGCIARPDGALDWLPAPQPGGPDFGYAGFMATVDVMVIGRNTFETALSFGGWPYGKMPVVVLSRRPLKIPPEIAGTVEHSSLEPRALVQSLSARGFTHAYVDGGVTIRSFLAAGLIQRLIVTRVPVILGAGIPLFGDAGQDIRLKHVRTDSFDNGLVQSEYMVDSSTAQEIR